ncbi:hypothetical protein ACPV4Z_18300 [Vibrio aestuarianus]|uniref:hypothetical protein n=1 Tax=Vibrio aestuarianus TaxID=28171 RepID=UPI0040677480
MTKLIELAIEYIESLKAYSEYRPVVLEAHTALAKELTTRQRSKVSGRAKCIIETAFTMARFKRDKLTLTS